ELLCEVKGPLQTLRRPAGQRSSFRPRAQIGLSKTSPSVRHSSQSLGVVKAQQEQLWREERMGDRGILPIDEDRGGIAGDHLVPPEVAVLERLGNALACQLAAEILKSRPAPAKSHYFFIGQPVGVVRLERRHIREERSD